MKDKYPKNLMLLIENALEMIHPELLDYDFFVDTIRDVVLKYNSHNKTAFKYKGVVKYFDEIGRKE